MTMTIKGQQQETLLVPRMQKYLRRFGQGTTLISGTRCSVRGLLFSYLTEEEMQQLADIHPSAPPLKGISDYDVKLVQRLLYYTRQDIWLSEQ